MKNATLLLFALVLLVAASGELFAQDQSSPLAVVNQFKAYIDDGNIAGMLSIYGDVDVDAPLQPSNYDRMRDPMHTLQSAWAKRSFEVTNEGELDKGGVVVYITSSETGEYVKFYTANYNGAWFVRDTETYPLTN